MGKNIRIIIVHIASSKYRIQIFRKRQTKPAKEIHWLDTVQWGVAEKMNPYMENSTVTFVRCRAQMPKNQHRTINTKRGNTCRDVRICQKGVANRFITYSVSDHPKEIAQRHALLKQRRINVDATSWRCIDVGATLYKRWCACWAAFHASKTFVGKSKWSCAKCTSNWGHAPRLFPDRHTLYVL